jgi:nicotinamidase-related amidase
MDYQPVVVSAIGRDAEQALAATVEAIEAARKAGVPVVFVHVAFRPGFKEISPANKFQQVVPSFGDAFVETQASAQVHPSLGATESDIVVTKRRVSAFAGGDLTQVLSALGVSHLVMAGLTTAGCVLSTLRQASDSDFGITVLSDACADFETDVHDFLVQRVFPSHADVVTAKKWASSL